MPRRLPEMKVINESRCSLEGPSYALVKAPRPGYGRTIEGDTCGWAGATRNGRQNSMVETAVRMHSQVWATALRAGRKTHNA